MAEKEIGGYDESLLRLYRVRAVDNRLEGRHLTLENVIGARVNKTVSDNSDDPTYIAGAENWKLNQEVVINE